MLKKKVGKQITQARTKPGPLLQGLAEIHGAHNWWLNQVSHKCTSICINLIFICVQWQMHSRSNIHSLLTLPVIRIRKQKSRLMTTLRMNQSSRAERHQKTADFVITLHVQHYENILVLAIIDIGAAQVLEKSGSEDHWFEPPAIQSACQNCSKWADGKYVVEKSCIKTDLYRFRQKIL